MDEAPSKMARTRPERLSGSRLPAPGPETAGPAAPAAAAVQEGGARHRDMCQEGTCQTGGAAPDSL